MHRYTTTIVTLHHHRTTTTTTIDVLSWTHRHRQVS
jgi:hypothetical protein